MLQWLRFTSETTLVSLTCYNLVAGQQTDSSLFLYTLFEISKFRSGFKIHNLKISRFRISNYQFNTSVNTYWSQLTHLSLTCSWHPIKNYHHHHHHHHHHHRHHHHHHHHHYCYYYKYWLLNSIKLNWN